MPDLDHILGLAPVIPVLTIERIDDAVPIARALVAGGLPVLEVTLRTACALDAIRAMRAVDGAIIGAGTVTTPALLEAAAEAGAAFAVSPGLTRALGHAAAASPLPFLPGVATASEIMRALDFGFTRLKFFPATQSGGIPALTAFAVVFPAVRFCPTGGITRENAPDWLALDPVACVGGSWLVPAGAAPDFEAITARATAAASLGAKNPLSLEGEG